MGLGGAAGFLQYRKHKSSKMEVTKVVENSSKPSSGNPDNEKKEWPLNVQNLQSAAVPTNLD